MIVEHMFTQCDPEGNQYLLLDSIIDHKIEGSAMKESDQYIIVNGRKHHRKTMTGVKVCARWKDGTMLWEQMVDIKQSYPLELSEYAIAQGINETPAFAWWVPFVLRKRK